MHEEALVVAAGEIAALAPCVEQRVVGVGVGDGELGGCDIRGVFREL